MNNIMNTIVKFYNYLLPYLPYIGMGIMLALILTIRSGKFRHLIARYIIDAETGKLNKTTSVYVNKIVDKLQKTDWDDRMILVVANLIHSIGPLRLIPTSLTANFLKKKVQQYFDELKEYSTVVDIRDVPPNEDELSSTIINAMTDQDVKELEKLSHDLISLFNRNK